MATSFTFNDQVVELPGVYSMFKSGVTNPPQSLPYGNVLIIDTGIGAGYGAGAGIAGTLASGSKAVYQSSTLSGFRGGVGGGVLWDIASNLFIPDGPGSTGVSKLFYARAAETTPASVKLTLDNGMVEIQVRNEGTVGNGVLTTVGSNQVLTKGYGIQLEAGVLDSSKYVLKFFRGSYRGVDADGNEIGGQEDTTQPDIVIRSPEVSTVDELVSWMKTNMRFGSHFKLSDSSGTGALTPNDIIAYGDMTLLAGGTENYSSAYVDDVLEQVQRLDYSLVLALDSGDDAKSLDNGKILTHLTDADTFGDKLMIVGGGDDENNFTGGANSSISIAEYYDTDRVVVCHGGPIETSNLVASGIIEKSSLYKAATICGRLAGLPPYIPITFKKVGLDGDRHELSITQQKQALRGGVLATVSEGSTVRVLQGVNTVQENDFLVNQDATTHSIQLRRMMAQVNRELVVNAYERLFKNPVGTNRHTLSESDVLTFTEGYLRSITVRPTQDNMIISFRNVNVELDNDAYRVTYDVIFNTEITKMFFTGTVFLNFN